MRQECGALTVTDTVDLKQVCALHKDDLQDDHCAMNIHHKMKSRDLMITRLTSMRCSFLLELFLCEIYLNILITISNEEKRLRNKNPSLKNNIAKGSLSESLNLSLS